MSKAYEDLPREEKVIELVHFPSRLGPGLDQILKSMERQFENLNIEFEDIINDSFQLDNALGSDLDKLGAIHDFKRWSDNTDEEYRTLLKSFVANFQTVTVDAIQDLFERVTGRRPYIVEGFSTNVQLVGTTDPVPAEDKGRFEVIFEIPRAIVHEQLPIESGGTHVVLGHSNIVSEDTTAVSDTTAVTSGDTTIYAGSVTGFNATGGKIIIEDEWIKYTEALSTPDRFTGCVRGIFETVAASHNTATLITEGLTNAFPSGELKTIFDSRIGQNVYVKDGPYEIGTKIDTEYQVTVEEDFNTLEEIVAAIDIFEVMGMEYKAAGVIVSFAMGVIIQSWFQEAYEALTLSDLFQVILDWAETFTPPTFDGIFFNQGEWDKGAWNACAWDSDMTPSGDYYLVIDSTDDFTP